MLINPHFNLRAYAAMKCGPEEVQAVYIETPEDIAFALSYAKEKKLTPHFLGSATNSIFSETIGNTHLFIISNIVAATQEGNTFTFGSGLLWDEAVAFSTERGYSGIEALSLIPGTTGAAPVQNIGAYGTEIKDTLVSVEAYDAVEKKEVTLTRSDCAFSYRDSIFKQNPDRYFITSITLTLSTIKPAIPAYKDVVTYFKEKNILEPNVSEIRNAIIDIRNKKLPDYRNTPNLGSYFKNPVISKTEAEKLLAVFPSLPNHPNTDGSVKLFAGWLIEQADCKGITRNHFGTYEKNALVLVGDGIGTTEELFSFEEYIRTKVKEKFGITLEREPIFVQ